MDKRFQGKKECMGSFFGMYRYIDKNNCMYYYNSCVLYVFSDTLPVVMSSDCVIKHLKPYKICYLQKTHTLFLYKKKIWFIERSESTLKTTVASKFATED